MLSDVVGQFIVLLILIGEWITGTVLSLRVWRCELRDTISFGNWIIRTVPMIFEQVFDDGGVVEEAVNIGADAMVSL